MMTPPSLLIEHVYTRDRVYDEYDIPGVESGWKCSPVAPDCSGRWEIFDSSPDYKTGWRRISLLGALVA